jgi:hypothetical protein
VAAVAALAAGSLAVIAASSAAGAAKPACTIQGTSDRDVLRGTSGDDVICGRGGRDVIFGRDGDDIVDGGSGSDRLLLGGAGDDTVQGGTGDDFLLDDEGANVLDGGRGDRDRCFGGLDTTFVGCRFEYVLPRGSADETIAEAGLPVKEADDGPQFDAAASSVEVRGDALAVTFAVTGMDADAASRLEFTATRTTSVGCSPASRPDSVALSMSSTARVTETGTYGADAEGNVRGVRTLHVRSGTVQLGGYICKETDDVLVTLRDLGSGATITLTP